MYAADGSWNMHIVDGLTYVGLYAPEGCFNGTATTGTVPVPAIHPSGALTVTTAPGGLVNRRAPDGSLYINSVGAIDGSQRVTFI